MVAETIAWLDGIDVWTNTPPSARWSFMENTTADEMRRVIEVNLLGPICAVRAALPHLRRSGRGVIINVASALADRGIPLLATYAASKAVTILPSSINTPFYRWGPSIRSRS